MRNIFHKNPFNMLWIVIARCSYPHTIEPIDSNYYFILCFHSTAHIRIEKLKRKSFYKQKYLNPHYSLLLMLTDLYFILNEKPSCTAITIQLFKTNKK